MTESVASTSFVRRRRRLRACDGRRRCGFSLIEMVMVIVIMGIIAAIAIPKISQAGSGAARATGDENRSLLERSIDLYHAEHGGYPAAANIAQQLTGYTDVSGNTSALKQPPFIYGPYLRQVPPLMTGTNKGNRAIAATAGAGVGWIYSETDGTLAENTQ